jgi:hypothetical protein
MKPNAYAHPLAALVLGVVSLVAAAAPPGDEGIAQTPGNVSYISGGVGLDSIERLTAMSGSFNLKLVFALKSGDYLSNVRVAIADARGNTVLDTTSDGPWLMTKLPAGNYQIAASFGGATERRSIALAAGNLRTVDFRWAAE